MSFSTLNASATKTQLFFLGSYSGSLAGTINFPVSEDALSPAPQVMFADANGALLSSVTENIALSSFKDSNCSQSTNQGVAFVSVTPKGGIATFNGLVNTRAGTYYVQASATLASGEKIKSACSRGILFTAGAPDHLLSADAVANAAADVGNIANPMPLITGTNSGASFLLRAQVVDAFGNPVVPATAVTVTFSGFSANVTGGSGFTSVVSTTNTSGIASISVAPDTTQNPWAIYQASAPVGFLPGAKPLLFPVQFVGNSATQLVLEDFPVRLFASDPQTLRVSAADVNSIKIPSYSSTVQISNDNGTTLTSVPLSSAGAAYSSLGVTAGGGGVSAYFNGGTGPSGSVVGSLSSFSLTDASTDCAQGPSGPANAVTGATGDWSSPAGWDTSGSAAIPTIYNTAVISSGASKLVGGPSGIVQVGCVQLDGTLTFQPNTTLQVKRSQFVMTSGASVSAAQGNAEILQFARGLAEGPGSQRLVISGAATLGLDVLQISPAVTGVSGTDGYAFFINGRSGTLNVGSFNLSSNLGGEHYAIYVNTNLNISQLLTIPQGVELIVNPGATLYVALGASVSGTLKVRGSGVLKVGSGQKISVLSGGKLSLQGLGQVGSSETTNLAVVQSVNGSSSFAIGIAGSATLDASHFLISGLSQVGVDTGLDIKAGSTVSNFRHGIIKNWNPSFAALTLGSGSQFTNKFILDLQFQDPNGSTSSSTTFIDGSTLVSPLGILHSRVGGSNSDSLKMHTTAPAGMVYWDY
ncbi:MAG: hypothetical protein HYX41_05800 [Bdellovibrio sp.]|nr:hypothetical protein [Bdellovibrio sp.]